MKKDVPLYYDKEQEYLKQIADLKEELFQAYLAMGAKPDMRFKKNRKYKEAYAVKKAASKKKKASLKG